MTNFQTVIFDMDGVIIDSEPIYFQIQQKLFDQLGFIVSEQEYDQFIGAGMKLMWQILKQNKKLEQSIDELIKLNNDIVYDNFRQMTNLKPMSGFLDLIRSCSEHELKIGLASSTARRTILAILKNLKITDFFEVIVSGEEVIEGKPAPDIFLSAARQLKSAPAECIVIEDSTNGIKAAKSAGMYCIALQNPAYQKQDVNQADAVFSNLIDLKKHIFS